MALSIKSICVGPLDVNCYLVSCTDHNVCAVIDPGDAATRILQTIEKDGLTVISIINTHGHADHTGAVRRLKESTGAPYLIHTDDAALSRAVEAAEMAAFIGVDTPPEPDRLINNGDTIDLCDCHSINVLHTPGHTPGGVCLMTEGNLITGDTLFRMSVGRTDLPGGDAYTLQNSIRTTIFPLDDTTIIYPGHGDSSTLGFEKSHNPFLMGTFI